MSTIHDLVSLHALHALHGEDLVDFEAHLRAGCDHCQAELRSYSDVLGQLALALPSLEPPSEARDRLLSRIRQTVGDQGEPPAEPAACSLEPFNSIRANEGVWIEWSPGIHIKPLYISTERNYSTTLVRLAPGAVYPGHRHLGTEELFIVEGECDIDGRHFKAGDYHRAEQGSLHRVTRTDRGCVLLIIANGGHVCDPSLEA